MADKSEDIGEAEIDVRFQMAVALAQRHLGEHELQVVRSRIARRLYMANQLRAVPLGNDDEPAHTFNPSLSTTCLDGTQPS